jgi:hypothetical protein
MTVRLRINSIDEFDDSDRDHSEIVWLNLNDPLSAISAIRKVSSRLEKELGKRTQTLCSRNTIIAVASTRFAIRRRDATSIIARSINPDFSRDKAELVGAAH